MPHSQSKIIIKRENIEKNTSKGNVFSADTMWSGDAALSLSWLHEATNLQCSAVQADDVSNAMRKGSRVRDGATIRLTLTRPVGQEKSEKDDDCLQPETLIIKQAVTEQSKALSKQLGLSREALFFKHLAPKIALDINPYILPKVYYSMGSFDGDGSKVIVMEDIDGIDSGIMFGNGNPNNWKRDLPRMLKQLPHCPSSEDVARVSFQECAKIHALFWRDTTLLSEDYHWLRGQNWLQGHGKESWTASQRLIQGFWSKYTKAEQDPEASQAVSVIEWDPTVRSTVEKAVKGISWEAQVERLNKDRQYTLVHGDFWPGNIMWLKHVAEESGKSIKFVDWEMVGLGSGPQELGQYVISNMDPSDRRKCEESLVRSYYEELQTALNGKTDMTWDECWEEYKIGGVERWLWFLIYFVGQPGMSVWAQYFHNQLCAFIRDHGLSPKNITQPRP